MGESIYEAWHRSLGHAEYRVTLTMSGHGSDEAVAEDFLEGYLQTHPDAGPIVSQNSKDDTISVTLSVRASTQQRALELAVEIFVAGGEKSGVPPGRAVRAEVELVGERDDAETAERVYA